MKMKLSQLRRLIREELERSRLSVLLREAEADLSGKSLSLVGRLKQLNLSIRDHGVEVGIKLGFSSGGEFFYVDSSGNFICGFAFRSTKDTNSKVRFVNDDDTTSGIAKELGIPEDKAESVPYGFIVFGVPKKKGECSGAFVVSYVSETTDGWGPLLYDLAMEYATQQGGGLASDRRSVSSAAQVVWNKYDTVRSDVQPVQLDTFGAYGRDEYKLTPDDPADDCDQTKVFNDLFGGFPPPGEEKAWVKSPLSRAYRKPDGAVMSALESAGLLWQ